VRNEDGRRPVLPEPCEPSRAVIKSIPVKDPPGSASLPYSATRATQDACHIFVPVRVAVLRTFAQEHPENVSFGFFSL